MPPGLTGLNPARRHRVVAEGFAEQVGAVTDWDAPTPVDGWVARDVVGHLVDWFPAFLAAGGVSLPASPPVADDPLRAWRAQTDAVQALLDGDAAQTSFRHPMAGTHVLADAVDQFYTADVFMHTWDLAAAAGRRADLDPGFAAELADGMAGIEELLRSSGQYGPAVPVAADADPVTRLVGFIGRDPNWRAAAP
ncbi:maleylpyruvate isomerase family mycothiol-dependent enzyme [Gordonia sp. ABSL1-1]|uniref:maleylpyruvate isomerase family mycothiol-dependent enzyme n=1 Tax=Gordonia sp. ABSL1-1 TaxID=3053923 RepID=UPI00257267ED|nr:maleylpyruvate isomerase family mycothiol-dependent enzyme [Gordonia sp. ABSL1-1]MDL9937944.1 maleylpyruvate isomerase family mycothiol-dependent enzyme [Gordonia sp. ABSL1-1]